MYDTEATRYRLIEALESFDPTGADAGVTRRLLQLYQECNARGLFGAAKRLANMYFEGVRVPRNIEMGLQVLRLEWNTLNPFRKGQGGLEYAAALFRNGKSSEGMEVLGEMCAPDTVVLAQDVGEGLLVMVDILTAGRHGVQKDEARAREVLGYWCNLEEDEPDINKHYGAMHHRYGKILEEGVGGPVDLRGAVDAYQMAVMQGVDEAHSDMNRVVEALRKE